MFLGCGLSQTMRAMMRAHKNPAECYLFDYLLLYFMCGVKAMKSGAIFVLALR